MMTTSPEQAAASLLPPAASPELVASIQHALALKDLLEQEFEALRAAGFEILNDVVFNQVLVDFGGPEVTRRAHFEIEDVHCRRARPAQAARAVRPDM